MRGVSESFRSGNHFGPAHLNSGLRLDLPYPPVSLLPFLRFLVYRCVPQMSLRERFLFQYLRVCLEPILSRGLRSFFLFSGGCFALKRSLKKTTRVLSCSCPQRATILFRRSISPDSLLQLDPVHPSEKELTVWAMGRLVRFELSAEE